MTQEEMQAIKSMMEDVTKASEKRMCQMMDERFEAVYEQLAEIREDTAITRTATNTLVEWADDVSVITQIKYPVKK